MRLLRSLALRACRPWPGVLLAALAPGLVAAAPGDILFSDGFEDGTLPAWTASNPAVAGVSSAAGWVGSGAFGAYTSNTAVTVTSPTFNAAVPEARLTIWVRRGSDAFSEDTDAGEDFVLEYQRANSSWGVLRTYLGSGTNGQIYNDAFILPPDALHGALALRVRQTGGSGPTYDFWHFDDVIVTEIGPAPPLAVDSCDDFESGLSGNWTVTPTTGFAGVNSATSQSPLSAMFLNGGVVSVESNIVDTSPREFGDLTLWVRRGADAFSEDPDGGENLIIEYLNDLGSWVSLETFTGSGLPGQIFNRAYTLPPSGRHANFRLRFRMTAGSGEPWDFWHVDDVCFDLSNDPVLLVTKLVQLLSDPINGTTNPKSIPGAVTRFTVGVTNQGAGSVDSDTVVIEDVVPANTALFVDTGAGDPLQFVDGPTPSGLAYDFATDVTFSDQPGGGAPFDYTPVPDADGFDPAVTGFRINPGGSMNGSSGGNDPSFNIRFRVRVE